MAVTRTAFALALFLGMTALSPALAGAIESACSQSSGRANARVCGCIQSVADRMLTRDDQRLAASFFKDPDLAQQMRTSDSARDESFWQRYIRFGAAAEQNCR